MTTQKKTSALKAAFKTAKKPVASTTTAANGRGKQESGLVLIGANFPPGVRKAIGYIEVDTGKTLKQLLGEAINDLAVKYGKPEPYTED